MTLTGGVAFDRDRVDGRLTLSVRLLADPSDRRYLTALVHQVLVTFLAVRVLVQVFRPSAE
jgi:hypothetical protein